MADSEHRTDQALGMNEAITRRDFIGGALAASGALLLEPLTPAQLLAMQGDAARDDWTGYGGEGDYAHSNGNTLEVLTAGHKIRDGAFETLPADLVDTNETYDCVIVGGGISGLAAALFFQRIGGRKMTALVLENHPIFGGEAKRNEFIVDGRRLIAHQGSAIYLTPYPYSFIGRFYDSIGMTTPKLAYQTWSGPEPKMTLSRTPYESAGLTRGEYGFYFGAKFGQKPGLWVRDPLGEKMQGAPVSERTRNELYRWFSGSAIGPVKFTPPKYEGDEISRRLDSITLEQHYIERYGISRETIRNFLSPVEGGGSGLGPDALSAFSDYAADLLHPLNPDDSDSVQMFADGNTAFARLITKTLIPESIEGPQTLDAVCRNKVNFRSLDVAGGRVRIRLGATAVYVEHDGAADRSPRVMIVYTRGGKPYRVRARSVVMAGGSWTSKDIIRDLPEMQRAAYGQFYRSPCMMANVALRNWRFLYKMGMSGCRWFEGFGNYFDVCRQATCGIDSDSIGPDLPVVLSLKVLFSYPGMSTQEQGIRGRAELFSTSFRDYERQIREQFTDMFSHAGFEPRRDIAGIILNRWGHAYLSPQPGFFFGVNGKPAPREILRRGPFGRIAFANTDLAGAMDHRCSILEAHRAVRQLLDQVIV
jgi:spermidine dehydrogenase